MAWTRPSPLLIMVYDKTTLTALRVNGAQAPLSVPLAVNPLTDDPQVVAQEWRERLRPLGRLPRRVVVGLPLSRILACTVPLPTLPESEAEAYLRLQAEREFLLPPEELRLGLAVNSAAAGGLAVLAALAGRSFDNLERSLRLAGFRQITLAPAVAAASGTGTGLRLVMADDGADLVGSLDGRIVFLRRLAAGSGDPAADGAALPALLGDLRISLRQIPEALRAAVPTVEVVGHAAAADGLAAALRQAGVFGAWAVQARAASPSVAGMLCAELAAGLGGGRAPLLALSPLPSARVSTGLARWRRPLLTAAALVALLAIVGLSLALHQSRQRARLRSEWERLSPRVETVRALIDSARSRQPWLGDDAVTLDLLRAITLAFPERGSVWTTRLEISGRSQVVLAGQASDRDAWLKTLAGLRQTAGVRDLRVTQAREAAAGQAPLAFAVSFTWSRPVAGRAVAEERL
ncbi:MAG: hypothetical protein GX595_00975 [Lentisphaerae bacterium]|nr:hypothetical protein [Lentisphaerota bacterium]